MKSNYKFLYNTSMAEEREENGNRSPEAQDTIARQVDFWMKLIKLIVAVIEEDKAVYKNILNQ